MGVDGIELDVHVTTDGQLVVIHDFDVATTTDGHGLVSAMSAAEVRRLDAGSHFSPAFAGVRVPTLDEVFDLVGDRCQVNVEIKSLDTYARDASDAVAVFVRRRNLYDQVLVSSFNPITLVKLRHLDPRIALGMLYDEEMPAFFRAIWAGPPIRPEAQHPEHLLIDETYMAWARGLGCTGEYLDGQRRRRGAAAGCAGRKHDHDGRPGHHSDRPAGRHLMTEGRIRVIALGIFVRPRDHAVLAVCFPREDGQGVFYRPPGGGVEFGEYAIDAVQREMREELRQQVIVDRLLGVTENHFVLRERRGHEIVYNWLVRFDDESLYDVAEWTITESNGEIFPAHWVQPGELAKRGVPFYPDETAELIRKI